MPSSFPMKVSSANATGSAHRGESAVAHRFADTVSKKPRSFHAVNEHPLNLPGANPLLACAHKMDDLKPKVQRQMRGLENGPHADREWLTAFIAFAKAEARALACQFMDTLRVSAAAMRTIWAMRPKLALDIGESGFFILEMRG